MNLTGKYIQVLYGNTLPITTFVNSFVYPWVLHTAGSEGKQLSGVAGSEDAKRALHRRDGSSAATLLFKAIVQWKINK